MKVFGRLKYIFKALILGLFVFALTSVEEGVASSSNYPVMLSIVGGSYFLGSNSAKDEMPVHKVSVSDFKMSKYPVTVGQWKIYCDSNNIKMSEPPSWGWIDNHPMVKINWNEASAYCVWLSKVSGKKYRLPTEAEWEYAARGGNLSGKTLYSGSKMPIEVAWFSSTNAMLNGTRQVGTKAANELGLYDMSGNVWEFCGDNYKKYENAELTNPSIQSGSSFRVVRGGSWFSSEEQCRVSKRYFIDANKRYNDYGFRVVCEN